MMNMLVFAILDVYLFICFIIATYIIQAYIVFSFVDF